MDNKSLRLSTEDTATSMYLSFDAESTVSTACYKTMDMSAISMIEGLDESLNITNKTQDKHTNSTLEAQDDSSLKSPVKTVKKMEQMPIKTPLRALPKNILKEYKALSSTPSKEQLLKTVDVTRGSDATRCIDLGIAFLGVEDEKPAYFPPPPPAPMEQCEDNKENALPESEEGSTLSVSSSVEITTSVIERKLLSSMSTVGSITEEESVEEIKMDTAEDILIVKESVETTPKANKKKLMAEDVGLENKSECVKENVETTPKAKSDIPGNMMETIDEVLEKPDELTPKVNEVELNKKNVTSKSTGKQKIAVLSSRNTRRSVCEPNLQTNKPSRILNAVRKRQSFLPTGRKSTTPMDAETEIPLLMSKMLKISNNTSMQFNEVNPKKEETSKEPNKLVAPNEKRRSIMSNIKTRSSLIPSASGEKRPFSFTQRMSVVVKTTLNSPARKIARRSAMGTTMTAMQRRSLMPAKTSADACKAPPNLLGTRKSFLPKTLVATNTGTTGKTLTSLKEVTTTTTTTTLITQRKSIYPLTKLGEESKIKPPSGFAHNKPDASFTCNVCKEKFRVKSLLDAHKRSHENDNAAPAFVKKRSLTSSTSSISSGGNSNQCKYCDKKFALVKALHIHLLQNCSKIPPADKRKLQFTELNHVEKAQLPNVFSHHHQHNPYSSVSSTVSSTAATPRNLLKPNTMTFPKSSLESLSKQNNDAQKTTTNIKNGEGSNMAPPHGSVQKIKKPSAHAGVYRTPSKSVPCHSCKLTFKSILDFTNHSLTAHGNNKSQHNLDEGNEVVNENGTF